jgi:hypothetical protein
LQKNAASFAGGGNADHQYNKVLVRAVVFGVMAARFRLVMFGVAGVTMRAMRMVRRFIVIASFMVLGGFTVVLGRLLVMFSSLMMMLYARVVAHDSLPVQFSANGGMIRQAI